MTCCVFGETDEETNRFCGLPHPPKKNTSQIIPQRPSCFAPNAKAAGTPTIRMCHSWASRAWNNDVTACHSVHFGKKKNPWGCSLSAYLSGGLRRSSMEFSPDHYREVVGASDLDQGCPDFLIHSLRFRVNYQIPAKIIRKWQNQGNGLRENLQEYNFD